MSKKPRFTVVNTPRGTLIRGENLNIPLNDFVSELKAFDRIKSGKIHLTGEDNR